MAKPKIVYFGSDASDPATVRRIEKLAKAGAEITAFAFTRDGPKQKARHFNLVALGRLADGNLASRIIRLIASIPLALGHASHLRKARVIYCRNLDMVIYGMVLRRLTRSRAKVVYEVLDIHPLTTRSDRVGKLFRRLERRVLKSSSLLVVSSDRFFSDHFQLVQDYNGPCFLLENKLAIAAMPKSPRPKALLPLVIGYFGKLRCPESVKLLTDAARKHPDTLKIRLAGVEQSETKDRLAVLRALDNVTDLGPYRYPDDIPELYREVHLNWCLDLSDGVNSRLLLPNRIYEGGAMGVPALAEDGTATGEYVLGKKLGIVISTPFPGALDSLISQFTDAQFQKLRKRISAHPASAFFDIDQHSKLLERLENL